MSTTNPVPAKKKLPRSAKVIAVSAALLGALYGYDQSNVSSAQLFFVPDLKLDVTALESVAAAVPYGILLGVLVGGVFSDRVGRKKATVTVVIGYIVFCLAQAFAMGLVSLMAARILLGFTIGVSIVAVPVFIAESVATRIRGSVLVGYQVAEVLGIIIAYVIALAVQNMSISYNWRIMFGVAAIPAVILLPLVLAAPETPRWLMLRGRRSEAEKVLAQIDPDANAKEVLDSTEDAIREESGGRLKEMFQKPFLRATVFLLVLGFLIQITGINATITYGPALFENMGWTTHTSSISASMVVQLFAFVAVIVSMIYVDRWGRRPILISGFSGLLAGLILVIVVYGTATDGSWHGWQKALGFTGFIVMNAAFAFGIGGLVWAFASETLPVRLRAYGATTLLAADLVANIIVVQFFKSVQSAIGGAQTFGIFAVFCVIAIFFVYRYAPETKGRDVDDIREFWKNGGKWAEEAKS